MDDKKIHHNAFKETIDEIYKEMEDTLQKIDDTQNKVKSLTEEDQTPIRETGPELEDETMKEEERGPMVERIPEDMKASDPTTENEDEYTDKNITCIVEPLKDYKASMGILEMVDSIKSEVNKVVLGYDHVVENLLIALLAGGHVLLEGVPGIAKTTLAKTFTSILDMECRRIQFTPDMLPQDITGHFFYDQKSNDFEIRKGPIFSNMLLADEINRTTPKTQSALLEAMEERQATIEGHTFYLPEPFVVIATINPLEHDGVYQLPLAQSDRFMLKINMGYVSKDKELQFLKMKANGDKHYDSLKSVELEPLIAAYRSIYVNESVVSYINDIISLTRDDERISIGASPRAAEQMLYAAKAHACISGRDYVIPDDIKAIADNILNHRLLLAPDIEDVSINLVIREILDSVKVPLEKR